MYGVSSARASGGLTPSKAPIPGELGNRWRVSGLCLSSAAVLSRFKKSAYLTCEPVLERYGQGQILTKKPFFCVCQPVQAKKRYSNTQRFCICSINIKKSQQHPLQVQRQSISLTHTKYTHKLDKMQTNVCTHTDTYHRQKDTHTHTQTKVTHRGKNDTHANKNFLLL